MKKTGALAFALAAAAVFALFTACGEQDPAAMAGEWSLARFGESETSYAEFGGEGRAPSVSITVSEDKTSLIVSFKSILNTYEGTYLINEDSSLSPGGDFLSTAVAGSEEDMRTDDELGRAITSLSGWLTGEVDAEDGAKRDALVLTSEQENRVFVFTKE